MYANNNNNTHITIPTMPEKELHTDQKVLDGHLASQLIHVACFTPVLDA